MSNYTNSTIYLGVTSDLEKRVLEHKRKTKEESFTKKYNCNKLVYYETFGNIEYAITREKQLKNWKRDWKNELVAKINSEWLELTP